LHGANSFVLLVVMLVALLVSILAAATAGLSWGRVIVQLLLPILLIGQIGLFILHDALGGTQQNPLPGVLGLHALNGLLIFGIAFMQTRAAFRLVRGRERGVPGPAPAPAAQPR